VTGGAVGAPPPGGGDDVAVGVGDADDAVSAGAVVAGAAAFAEGAAGVAVVAEVRPAEVLLAEVAAVLLSEAAPRSATVAAFGRVAGE
jgi:hypothetical protein